MQDVSGSDQWDSDQRHIVDKIRLEWGQRQFSEEQIRHMEGITYINCGDWVENCTAIVEHFDGRLELLDLKHLEWEEISPFQERVDRKPKKLKTAKQLFGAIGAGQ